MTSIKNKKYINKLKKQWLCWPNCYQMDVPLNSFVIWKLRVQSRIIHSIHSATRQVLPEPADTRSHAIEFYSDPYKLGLVEFGTAADEFFDGLPNVYEDSNRELEQTLSLQELYIAMMSMDNGNSPGIDGLPVEFHKTLWPVIGAVLLTVLNDNLK